MAETSFKEFVIPGPYVRVRAEALISAGGVSTGNIGIVGTAKTGYGKTCNLSSYDDAKNVFGDYDAYDSGAGKHNLTRGLEVLYRNGARMIYARGLEATPDASGKDDYTAAFNELVKEDVNILVAPELSTADALEVLSSIVETAESNDKDLIAVVGSDATAPADILAQVPGKYRIILSTPGFMAFDAAASDGAGTDVVLDGRYSAAAVAGLISTLGPEASPTNKALPGVTKLSQKYSYGEMLQLVKGQVLVLEERQGVRVVRGVTTDNGAFRQITTRRITDYAKAGIRQASSPFIGRLNNQRVRKALQGAIDGFLTTMVLDEMLTMYNLEVTASRQDEIAGIARVNVTLQPTFSIDFIAITLVLQ